MAKWGETDPRWIVEERPDATNVNNWHWVEKNATGWSKDKLQELLAGLTIENENTFCEIKELTSLDGEATANNRKAKLIFFYEWDIKAEWRGKLKNGTKKYKGNLEIPNLSEENSPQEIDVVVSVEDEDEEACIVKEFMRTTGTKKIRNHLEKYIEALKREYSQGIILPTKNSSESKSTETIKAGVKGAKEELNKTENGVKDCTNAGLNISTGTLKSKEEFRCNADELYRAFTDAEMMRTLTNCEVLLECERGGRFSFYEDYVSGQFTELVPAKKIVQKWRLKTWPEGHYSEVNLEFEEQADCTQLYLVQKEVPSNELDNTLDGWKRHYWQRMKQIFGFGAQLL